MGVRIIEGRADGCKNAAVLYDSVTETAFGPLFKDAEEAQGFLDSFAVHQKGDPRTYSDADLKKALIEWRALVGS